MNEGRFEATLEELRRTEKSAALAVVNCLAAEMLEWMKERRSGTLTVSVKINQGGIADNRFTVMEERKAG